MRERQQTIALREACYRGIFENMYNHFVCFRVITDNKGMPVDLEYVDFNPAYEKHTELKSDALIGRRVSEFFPGIEKENWVRAISEVASIGDLKVIEQYSAVMGKWYRVCAYCPEIGHAAVVLEDISERKEREEQLEHYAAELEETNKQLTFSKACFRGISYAIADTKQNFLDRLLSFIQQESNCNFVGIRVLDTTEYMPYVAHTGFCAEFLQSESVFSIVQDECICSRIMKGLTLDHELPSLTNAGSFWCNDYQSFMQALSEDETKFYREECVGIGYRSLAIIPVSCGDTVMAVIHLADFNPDKLSLTTIQLIEAIGPLVGQVLNKHSIENTLRESEKRYRELVEDASVIIMNLDKNGKILFINEFGARLLGYQTAELVNCSYKETLLPQFDSTGRNMWSEFDNIFVETDHKRSTREIVRKDGRRIWVEWTNRLRYHQGNGQLHLISVGVDITQRRRASVSAKIVYQRRLHKKIIDNLLEGHITQEEFFIIMEKDGPLMPQPLACCLVVFDFTKDSLKFLTEDMEEWQAWLDMAVDLISARFGGMVWHSSNGIVIVKNIDVRNCKTVSNFTLWVQNIANEMKDVFRGIDYIIGVSDIHKDIKAVYCQAAEAAKVGPIFHPDNNVYYWRDLGVSRLILEQVKSDKGFLFIQQYLGPLLEKSSLRHKELLITLKALLCGDPISLLAKRLYIHPKTIAFRKKRIERLLQVRLDDPETRLNITVALKLLELQDKL